MGTAGQATSEVWKFGMGRSEGRAWLEGRFKFPVMGQPERQGLALFLSVTVALS